MTIPLVSCQHSPVQPPAQMLAQGPPVSSFLEGPLSYHPRPWSVSLHLMCYAHIAACIGLLTFCPPVRSCPLHYRAADKAHSVLTGNGAVERRSASVAEP